MTGGISSVALRRTNYPGTPTEGSSHLSWRSQAFSKEWLYYFLFWGRNLIITLASQLTGEALGSEWDPRWSIFDESETIRTGLVAQREYGGGSCLGNIQFWGLMGWSEGPRKRERTVWFRECCWPQWKARENGLGRLLREPGTLERSPQGH